MMTMANGNGVAVGINNYDQSNQVANGDLKYILDVSSLVTNVSAMDINLPSSPAANENLRAIAQERKDVMMKRRDPLLDYRA